MKRIYWQTDLKTTMNNRSRRSTSAGNPSWLRPGTHRLGLTLVEMLVATAVTLVLVLAVTEAFVIVSEVISVNRANIEMSSQLRRASLRLQQDLDGVTSPVVPWIDSAAAHGYFEYVDGLARDGNQTLAPATQHFGDWDDVLAFTTRTANEPFVGTFDFGPIESDVAEMIWWAVPVLDVDDNPISFTLHRRALLVKPELNDPLTGRLLTIPDFTPAALVRFYSENDISVRPVLANPADPSSGIIGVAANSLNDLTLRQNRFAHYPIELVGGRWTLNLISGYPFELDLNVGPTSLFNLRQSGFQIGYDIILPNLLAFDVRAYDVQAPINAHPGFDGAWGTLGIDDDGNSTPDDVTEAGWPGTDDEALIPGDPGWVYTPQTFLGTGAYVDLHYLLGYPTQILPTASQFSHMTEKRTNPAGDILLGIATPTYDTWPFDFERDGLNEDLDDVVDESIDGIDNDGAGAVDEYGERETRPPYSTKLRGIQVQIRVMDPDTRQVRQQTVRADFTLE